MPTDTQRAPSEAELETVGPAIRDAMVAMRCAQRSLDRAALGMSQPEWDVLHDADLAAKHALIIAIAKRVREAEGDRERLDWLLSRAIGEEDDDARVTDVYLPMLDVRTVDGVSPAVLRANIDARIKLAKETPHA